MYKEFITKLKEFSSEELNLRSDLFFFLRFFVFYLWERERERLREREREREHKQGEQQREREKQTLHPRTLRI